MLKFRLILLEFGGADACPDTVNAGRKNRMRVYSQCV